MLYLEIARGPTWNNVISQNRSIPDLPANPLPQVGSAAEIPSLAAILAQTKPKEPTGSPREVRTVRMGEDNHLPSPIHRY